MALTEDSALSTEGLDEAPAIGGSRMMVRKRNGDLEPVDLNKIVRAIHRCAEGLSGVDPMKIATRTISGLCDGATTEELDALSIRTASTLMVEEPNYSRLAGRLLATVIDKEVRNQNIHSFSQSVLIGHELGIIGDTTVEFVTANARKLDDTVVHDRDNLFEFFGLRTVYDRYLLRHPESRHVLETPQYFFLRVACGLSTCPDEAIRFYELISSLQYLPSSPTLFNSGTTHSQMSSCYLLDSPEDSLEGIYKRYTDIARLSKFAGGIGVAWHRIRAKGSLIKGTNGLSNGIVPWLKTLDSSVAAVNQGGRRKGAACIYLETWHADIEDFLDLRENTGDHQRRTHNLNLANWVPDLFMERVEKDWVWSLFDPKKVPHLTDLYSDEFQAAYVKAEEEGLYERQVPARELYSRMMRSLAQTGNGWMTFKDASNTKCNQTGEPGRVVHLSNLCTEIIEVTDQDETAVCNLGSVNLGSLVVDDAFDFERLAEVVRVAVPFLDRVIDINYYPTPEAEHSNSLWRPVGMGLMGLQDVFFKLGLPFDSPEARTLSARISEEIYFNALWASTELAEVSGPHDNYSITRAAQGDLQFDLWGIEPTDPERWQGLRDRIAEHGLRNSLLIAIAPTATIASIVGCYECIEPQVSNIFKRETLSGEFLQINRYLVRELQGRGMWNEVMANKIKSAEGSVQGIDDIPEDLQAVYRTAWEVPMRSLIDMGAERGAFIDQSQSLNLFMESPTIGKLSSMYLHAWKSGLKTTYYLRSRPATRINKTTSNGNGTTPTPGQKPGGAKAFTDAEAVACSLENPESCEACD
ncbi:MAG: ribonucleoside-diphosphate reductase subunit alpha [Acidimicrobiales bacterium]|jgi:ribonucleoside-diphosphate reductase alpha chain|nr:ribonucleoside-diphosphate reductase subunit alpha [Acidimicrobiales bacterium]MDP7124101.1 ribonucleoside-diphosphate reductase subunit alpha [Acidimicrobiales bacterium]MDP7351686.1 ribonucleoside-diphosphate reductase subunit alpha [Acidimicrobiales bacterium]MDP7507341.1 ribonucleoside-diphosphate reductase subunit alpha [Acidimicrobiales bacterium]HJM32863.1 ribonucleoside-diphosphate reductase subunit alpha [Acidimicrobiales bacterium]|tara:strand:+ start:7675 stop:10101 length:2427 start_codon:yes stop_codon:yes gene_type:complete